jgi:hypothetical protein
MFWGDKMAKPTEYTIMAKGKSEEKALADAQKQYDKLNSQLQKKHVEPLAQPSSQEFVLECIVNKSISPDHAKALNANYKSDVSFTDAEKKAYKGYGQIQFKINLFLINQTYALSPIQGEALSPKKSTPAGRVDYGKRDNITKYL